MRRSDKHLSNAYPLGIPVQDRSEHESNMSGLAYGYIISRFTGPDSDLETGVHLGVQATRRLGHSPEYSDKKWRQIVEVVDLLPVDPRF